MKLLSAILALSLAAVLPAVAAENHVEHTRRPFAAGVDQLGDYVQSLSGQVVWQATHRLNTTTGAITTEPGVVAGAGVSIHVPTNAALQASPIYPFIERDGFYAAGDGGRASYSHGSAACPSWIPTGGTTTVGDNGAHVVASDGGCWNAMFQAKIVNMAMWGASPYQSNNAPFFDAAYAWASTVGGANLKSDGVTFPVGSTFDCHGANGTTWDGAAGSTTALYRATNYGSTMTCNGASNLKFSRMYWLHDISATPVTTFKNPTTNSAHFDFVNVSNVRWDDMTTWNLNYDYRLVAVIDAVWTNPYTQGFWSPTNQQTIAAISVDGTDGVGLGHSQLLRIFNPRFGSYDAFAQQTYTSAGNSNTIASVRQVYGPLDHVALYSVEDFQIYGGITGDAARSSIHIAPRNAAGKILSKIFTHGTFMDGAGSAGDVYIENANTQKVSGVCPAGAMATQVGMYDNQWDGELYGTRALSNPAETCPSVAGLKIENPDAYAYVTTPFQIGGAQGGEIRGGSIHGYNVYGVYANDSNNSSAVRLSGLTTAFSVDTAYGGGANYEPITVQPGPPYTALNQSMYGITADAGLVDVQWKNHSDGVWTDAPTNLPHVTCGSSGSPSAGGCTAQVGSNKYQGKVVSAASTSGVLVGAVAFPQPYSSGYVPSCVATAINSALVPVATSPLGDATSTVMNFVFASDIGNGGSFRYRCD